MITEEKMNLETIEQIDNALIRCRNQRQMINGALANVRYNREMDPDDKAKDIAKLELNFAQVEAMEDVLLVRKREIRENGQ